jgi:pyruvate ferredoxin oxidoreductase beta subunit
VLYVCYDNEAYMNTGVQRSGATPAFARTATSEPLGQQAGAPPGRGKDLPRIAMAHGIPYVATASVAELHDLEAKVTKAMQRRGPRYLHVLVPCPLGWGSAPSDTVSLARLAQRSGLFPVYEAESGEVTSVLPIRGLVPVEDYLRPQRRYQHLFGDPGRPDLVRALQGQADATIRRLGIEVQGSTR